VQFHYEPPTIDEMMPGAFARRRCVASRSNSTTRRETERIYARRQRVLLEYKSYTTVFQAPAVSVSLTKNSVVYSEHNLTGENEKHT